MTTTDMLIIKDARGEVIAAQVEDAADSAAMTYITPAQEGHTLHRVSGVPAEIHNLTNPAEFQKAIASHIKSGSAKITQTSARELDAAFASRLKK